MSDFNLGTVTAYGYAKDKGYTGTEDEYAELMASYADVAEQAAESATQAAASATTASTKASDAAQSATAAESSKTAAQTAQTGAETAAQTATTKAGEASTSATTASNKATEATTAATTATGKATEAAGSATTATTKAGEASTSATNAAASATRAQEILDSIPADYSQLSEDVDTLKDGLHSYNSYDMLRQFGTFTSRTSGGVTYTWNSDKTICTATGTASGVSVTYLYNVADSIPQGMVAGGTYHVEVNTSDENLFLDMNSYNGSTSIHDVFITDNTDYTLPLETTKVVIRIRTTSGKTVNNATISVKIFNADSNAILENKISSINNAMPHTVEVVENGADAAETTHNAVLVKNTESLFSGLVSSVYGKSTENVLARNKGDYIAPLTGLSSIPPTNAPIEDLMEVIKSYVGVGDLVYGNNTTLFDETCANGQIDCSSFVCAVLYGINYKNSRYVLGSSASNVMAEFCGDNLMNYGSMWTRYLSYRMAQFYANQRRLFDVPSNKTKALNVLRFGDLLFVSDNTDCYKNIYHVMMVIGTVPRSNIVIVAQAGSGGATENEDTGVTTGVITLTAENIQSSYRYFARPDYQSGQLPIKRDRLQINTSFSTSNYQPTQAGYGSATLNFIPVTAGQSVAYTGSSTSSDNITYTCVAWFYDDTMTYISRATITTNATTAPNNAKYVRFVFSIPSSSSRRIYLSDLDNFGYSIT